jgi:hypothetical protein
VLSHGARIYPELAPDGLWSTASDVARYILAVQRSLAGHGPLSRALAQQMLTPGLNHFGLGPIIGDDTQNPYFTFSGGNYGEISLFVAYNAGDAAVVLTNGDQGYELALDIIRSIAQVYDWPDFRPVTRRVGPLDPNDLAGLPGAYQLGPGQFIAITRIGHELELQGLGLGSQSLEPISPHRFFLRGATPRSFFPRADEIDLEAQTGHGGTVEKLTLLLNGATPGGVATRLDAAAAEPVLAHLVEVARRFREQRPTQGDEDALRQLIGQIASGDTAQARVTPEILAILRRDEISNQRIFDADGIVESIEYRRTAPDGTDFYRVNLAHGAADFGIQLDKEGVIRELRLHLN